MTVTNDNEPDYVWSSNEEDFRFDDLEDLIDCEDLQAGVTVYRGIRNGFSPSNFVPDASWVVEQMEELAYDRADEHAEGWPEVSREAKDELDTFLKEWANKHCGPCTFYTVKDVTPYTITQEDLT